MSRPGRPFPSNLRIRHAQKCHGRTSKEGQAKWASCGIEGWKEVTKFHSANRKRCHGTVRGTRLARAPIRNHKFEKAVTKKARTRLRTPIPDLHKVEKDEPGFWRARRHRRAES